MPPKIESPKKLPPAKDVKNILSDSDSLSSSEDGII
jgi:hypothetical protein